MQYVYITHHTASKVEQTVVTEKNGLFGLTAQWAVDTPSIHGHIKYKVYQVYNDASPCQQNRVELF